MILQLAIFTILNSSDFIINKYSSHQNEMGAVVLILNRLILYLKVKILAE